MCWLSRHRVARVLRASSAVLLLFAAWVTRISRSPALCAPAAVTMPGFSIHEVSGVQVYFSRAPGDTAAIGALMQAGIGNEAQDESHCAHMAEHMVLMYPTVSGENIWDLATQGWKQGTLPTCGGHTSLDTTEFGFAVSQGDLEKALAMLLESLFSNRLAPGSAYDAEIARSQSEIAYMTTGAIAAPLWRSTFNLLHGTPYDENGFETGFQAVTPQKIRGFMDREYSPQRLTLVVIADCDEQAVLDSVRNGLRDIKSGNPPTRWSIDLAPIERDSMHLRVVGQPQVVLGLCFSGVSAEDYTAVQALLMALLRNRTETSVSGLKADPRVAMASLTATVNTLVFAYPLGQSTGQADQEKVAESLLSSFQELIRSYAATGPSEKDLAQGISQLDPNMQKAVEALPQAYLDVQQAVAMLIPGVLSPKDISSPSPSEAASDTRERVTEAASKYLSSAKVSVLIVTGDTVKGATATLSVQTYAAILAGVTGVGLLWWGGRRRRSRPN